MKCAVIGGSTLDAALTDEEKAEYRGLGVWMADHKIEVLTGGCAGYPLLVGQGCMEAGGICTGYSPASGPSEMGEYGHSPDSCSRFEFLENAGGSRNARLLSRSIPLVDEADIVLSLNGNWGTLLEQVAAVVCGKTMVVLESSGGASRDFHGIYEAVSAENHYRYGETVRFARSLCEAKEIFSAACEGTSCA